MGSRSQSVGAGFQRRIDALHATYEARDLAHILPRPETAVRQRGGGIAQYTRAVGADYSGVLRGGRGVALDAKSQASGGTFAIAPLVVRDAQWDDLRRTHAMGGLAFYALEVRGGPARGDYVIPWSWCDLARAAGHTSVPILGDRALGVLGPVPRGHDWLRVLVPSLLGRSL